MLFPFLSYMNPLINFSLHHLHHFVYTQNSKFSLFTFFQCPQCTPHKVGTQYVCIAMYSKIEKAVT